MTRPHSDSLFHFTRSLDALHGILVHGFRPRYCLESIGWAQTPLTHVAFPMVCFCDLPISKLANHVDYYGGGYGVGLTREWALKWGLNPVVYVNPGNALPQILRHLVEAADKQQDLALRATNMRAIRTLIAY